MIKLKLKNYKAFLDAELDIAPITVLLGANSSGKSSLLQLFLLLQQSYGINDKYDSPLKLNGKVVKLGEDENIFWNKSKKKELEIRIGCGLGSIHHRFRNIQRRLIDEMSSILSRIVDIARIIDSDHIIDDLEIKKLLLSSSRNRYEKELNERGGALLDTIPKVLRRLRKALKDDEKMAKINDVEPKIMSRISRRRKGTISSIEDLLNFNVKYYHSALSFIDQVLSEKFRRGWITYWFKLNDKREKIELSGFSIVDQLTDKTFISWRNEKSQRGYVNNLESDFVDSKILHEQRNKIAKNLKFFGLSSSIKNSRNVGPNFLNFEEVDDDPVNSLVYTLIYFVNTCVDRASLYFEEGQLNYIGPLRAFPERYYFLDESKQHSYVDTRDGNSLAELLKKDKKAATRVNLWLEKFGLNVNVEDFKDIIHKIKISQNSLRLDITDVGFGISQLLPIIVQGIVANRSSINIIEQPEIHLHPKLQSELADLFIDLITGVNMEGEVSINKFFLIETHSEYFLRRLRRRMAEGDKINPNLVNIYFIHGRSSMSEGAKIEKIEIGENGAFDWPSEYYSDEVEDTIEFLKHQK